VGAPALHSTGSGSYALSQKAPARAPAHAAPAHSAYTGGPVDERPLGTRPHLSRAVALPDEGGGAVPFTASSRRSHPTVKRAQGQGGRQCARPRLT
jgi:hypothetical protein